LQKSALQYKKLQQKALTTGSIDLILFPAYNGRWCSFYHILGTSWAIFLWPLFNSKLWGQRSKKLKSDFSYNGVYGEFRDFKNSFEGFPHDIKIQMIYHLTQQSLKMFLGKFRIWATHLLGTGTMRPLKKI
jgi:hypothetical protein